MKGVCRIGKDSENECERMGKNEGALTNEKTVSSINQPVIHVFMHSYLIKDSSICPINTSSFESQASRLVHACISHEVFTHQHRSVVLALPIHPSIHPSIKPPQKIENKKSYMHACMHLIPPSPRTLITPFILIPSYQSSTQTHPFRPPSEEIPSSRLTPKMRPRRRRHNYNDSVTCCCFLTFACTPHHRCPSRCVKRTCRVKGVGWGFRFFFFFIYLPKLMIVLLLFFSRFVRHRGFVSRERVD